jgi:Cu-Zn family superoxide dismutase
MSIRTRRLLLLGTASLAAVVWWAAPSGARVVPLATADLVNAAGDDLGTVTFLGASGHATELSVELDLPLPTGDLGLDAFHGLHIHAGGGCTGNFVTSAGDHWDDGTNDHGSHLGDLPSVLVGEDGEAELTADVPRFEVDAIVGRTVILHALPDNFNNVPTAYSGDAATRAATAARGDAGSRYGCGVIEAAGND